MGNPYRDAPPPPITPAWLLVLRDRCERAVRLRATENENGAHR